jgi:hypothetical protein
MKKKTTVRPEPRRKAGNDAPTTNPEGTFWSRLLPRLFAIDTRSLALFRIALGALLLVDLLIRLTDLNAMYADGGMFSRAEIRFRYTSAWNWSFHFWNGSAAFQATLFGLAILLALALLAGWKTRWAALGSWLLLLSVQHRVPTILNAGDGLLRLLLFWALFLPLDRVWSVAAWQQRRTSQAAGSDASSPVLSVASAAILIQMALMYFFSALFKSTPDWFQGKVIAGSLTHDFYAKPAGEYLLQFPALLPAMTLAVYALEAVGPLLLFFPKHTGRVRLLVIPALAAMHLGIELCLTVGLFSLIALTGLTLFLPAEFWNHRWLAGLTPATAQPPRPAIRGGSPQGRSMLRNLREGVCALLLVYVVALNVTGWLSHAQGKPSSAGWKFLNSACGLGQKWGMFDETPSKDGWYVARARLTDGSEVDLLQQGAPLTWDRPRFPAGMFPNHRWRKLFREMAYFDGFGYQVFREPVARFMRHQWNARSPAEKQVVELEFIYCTESPGGTPDGLPLRERLVRLD